MAVALVLAAGEGRRLGRPKALVELAGSLLVERVIGTCRQAMVTEVLVVTGAEASRVEQVARASLADGDDLAPVRFVENPRWKEGRTGSLQAGWSALDERTNVLLFPVDHPAVRLVTLDALLGVFGYAAAAPEALIPVVESDGERRRGHPVVLGSGLREGALALGPDQPLNVFLHGRKVLEVPVDDAGILVNVNEPGDLERARALLEHR